MFFRKLAAYRLDKSWDYSRDQLEALLSRARFQACGETEMMSSGWEAPLEGGAFVHEVGGQWLVCLNTQTKKVPGSLVQKLANEKMKALENSQGYKPSKKQIRELKELIHAEQLPKAFPKDTRLFAWIDPVNRWLGVDSTRSGADHFIERLKLALDALPLLPYKTALTPRMAMTQWIAASEAPNGFSIDRDCELRSSTEEKAIVRYTRHHLDGDQLQRHLEEGKQVTKLALTWNDRISFVLTEHLELVKLSFLDVVKEQAEQDAGEGGAAGLFDADLAIMAGEFVQLLTGLTDALGGETEQ